MFGPNHLPTDARRKCILSQESAPCGCKIPCSIISYNLETRLSLYSIILNDFLTTIQTSSTTIHNICLTTILYLTSSICIEVRYVIEIGGIKNSAPAKMSMW